MNFSASASNPTQYVKNEEMTGELMTAKTIFKHEAGHLFRHLRYTYTYDTENRVTSKEASKWDSSQAVSYTHLTVQIEYKVYIDRSGAYQTGIATVQSAYAPEFAGYGKSLSVTVR